ncbi:hypothetical protein LTR17_000196 [Elasticomyces elasticus]|nr:hypothetical protein LTR17_000196 [Elasticomyces elasticus]
MRGMSVGQEVVKWEGPSEGSQSWQHGKETAGEEDNTGSSQTPHDREDYTVAWISPLEVEQTAAIAMLDERRPALRQPSTDHNVYTLGSIYGLNVVITGLPLAGNTYAATAVAQMVRTFPRLRFGLLVGIGGGVPHTEAGRIRLGDVVVSKPVDEHSGAVQYDHGKAEAGGFRRTGFVAPPPMVLLNAAQRLSADRVLAPRDPLITHLQRINTSRRLLRHYRYPGVGEDFLYQPDYIHLKRSASCVQCGCDVGRLVTHDPEHHEGHLEGVEDEGHCITIHRGTIGAGEKVMRNGIERDQLAETYELLCFEMEAAGALNDFPCLVIRGISDYADSHKNNRWQGYAAAVAAAYARELFRHMPVDEVKQCMIPEIVVKQVAADTMFVASTTREAKFLEWLAPADFLANYKQACKLHHPGTGRWFLEGARYQQWKSLKDVVLWLHGGSGCGKTVLSSAIISDLLTAKSTVVYFFFDVNDSNKQSFDKMLRSLMFQLYKQVPAARTQLDKMCEGNQQPQTPALLTLWTALAFTVDDMSVVVDALDECKDWQDLLYQLPFIKCKQVRLLLTSRTEQEIEASLCRWVLKDDVVSVPQSPVDDDIRKVVRKRIAENHDLQDRWRAQPEVLTTIESRLMDKADGMFRLVVCQLDLLPNCLDRRSLDKTLRDLPKTLAGIYTRILHQIPDEHKEPAIRLLQFLLYGERPLRLEEAVDAIAVELDETPPFKPQYRMPEPREVARYCSSLTKISIMQDSDDEESEAEDSDAEDSDAEDSDEKGSDEEDSDKEDSGVSEVVQIQLAHASVNEYLVSELVPVNFKSSLEPKLAHEAIVSVCVAYLITAAKLSASDYSGNLPFAYFCARHWLVHAYKVEKRNLESSAWAVALLTSDRTRAYWLSVCGPEGSHDVNEPLPSPLYFACYGGLTDTVRVLLEQGADVNAHGGSCGNALNAASLQGHEKIVQLLLDNRANIDDNRPSRDYNKDYPNAIYIASRAGHEIIVRLLLERHPNINACGGTYISALNVACRAPHAEIVRLLLEAGADVNNEEVQRNGHDSALADACIGGHEGIVRMLIDGGADVNASGGSALQMSAGLGKVALMQKLLKHGAKTNAQGGLYGSALIAACVRTVDKTDPDDGVLQVVRLLVENGADVNYSHDDDYPNALYVEAGNGHVRVVQLLIEYGANVNAVGGQDGNALNTALANGHESTAQLLLAHGADINLDGRRFSNTLSSAAYGGCETVVRLLLEKGVDVNASDGEHGTALQAVCSASLSHEAILAVVHLLLAWGANVNLQSGEWSDNPLEGAVGNRSRPLVEMLIARGAYVNAPGGPLGRVLHGALDESDEDMVVLLLARGADINAPGDTEGVTALMRAAEWGPTSMVRLLLWEGADPNVHGGPYGNALNAAREFRDRRSSQRITQMLLAAGAVDYGPEVDWVTESETSTTQNHHSEGSDQSKHKGRVLERLRKSGLMGQQRRRLGKKHKVLLRWRGTVVREYIVLVDRLTARVIRVIGRDECEALDERMGKVGPKEYANWMLRVDVRRSGGGQTRRWPSYVAT